MADKLITDMPSSRIVPFSFPNKGRYRTWDSAWNPTGFAADPQYAGQQPLRYPEEWSPLRCFFASYDILKPWRMEPLLAAFLTVFA